MRRNYKKLLFALIGIIVLFFGAIVVNARVKSEKESGRLNYIVELKLGNGQYKYDYLYDFAGNERYTLVSGDDCYLIFDNFLNDYVEFSRTDKSFYCELEKECKKIYLAPTYYFYMTGNCIYDLMSKNELSSTEIEKYKVFENELKLSYKKVVPTNEVLKSGDDDPVYITNRYYYDNLRYNIGSNTSTSFPGSCTYVALEMLLTYYDSIENDNVIGETYDVTSTKSFSSYSNIDVEDYTASPGINDSFHSYLIQYGRNLGLTGSSSNSISISNMGELFDEYFDDRNLAITTHTTTSSTNKINFCKTAINSDNPVLILITGTDTSIDPDEINHAVVGYGYDDTGIYAHFGWKNNYHTNTNINNYTINNAFYITLNSSHSHSNNYLWTNNGCSGSVCPCGNISCNHGSYTYSSYNNTYHIKTCNACGHYVNEAHHYQLIGTNNVCSDCGHTVPHLHNYTYSYSWLNYNQHKAYCSCGSFHNELHVVSAKSLGDGVQYVTCILCGGPANAGIIPGFKGIQITENGSFLSPNGTLVLADEDIESYFEGRLIIQSNYSRIIDNEITPYLNRKEEILN